MKLLTPAELTVKNGCVTYMGKPISSEKVNAKQGVTVNHGSTKVYLPRGIYSLQELVQSKK